MSRDIADQLRKLADQLDPPPPTIVIPKQDMTMIEAANILRREHPDISTCVELRIWNYSHNAYPDVEFRIYGSSVKIAVDSGSNLKALIDAHLAVLRAEKAESRTPEDAIATALGDEFAGRVAEQDESA